jgi:hypothetical protein
MNPAASKPNTEMREDGKTSCATNMTFNFTAGAIAILVAGIIGYAVYAYFFKG